MDLCTAAAIFRWQVACWRRTDVARGCRVAFGHVVGRCRELMRYIEEQGPSVVLDVDDLLLREAMDVIGQR